MSSSEPSKSDSEYNCVEDDGELSIEHPEVIFTSFGEREDNPNKEFMPYAGEPLADGDDERQATYRALEVMLSRRFSRQVDVSEWAFFDGI